MIIRTASDDDTLEIAAVHVAAWQTAYRGIIPDHFLDQLSVDARRNLWREILAKDAPKEFTFVAELNGKVIGFANGGPEHKNDSQFAGELYGLYLLDEFRGRGIGTALLNRSVERLIELGLTSMKVWVLQDNPYCGFYERHGGIVAQEEMIMIAEIELCEVAYEWTNLAR